jgi:hypothetical protein
LAFNSCNNISIDSLYNNQYEIIGYGKTTENGILSNILKEGIVNILNSDHYAYITHFNKSRQILAEGLNVDDVKTAIDEDGAGYYNYKIKKNDFIEFERLDEGHVRWELKGTFSAIPPISAPTPTLRARVIRHPLPYPSDALYSLRDTGTIQRLKLSSLELQAEVL